MKERTIPQAAPGAGYAARASALDKALRKVMRSGVYILGREVAAFEAEFAAYLGAKHAVGVASGTDALELALRALGVGAGDAVLTVSLTAVATAAAVSRCGAVPVFVDIDPGTFTMAPESLAEALRVLRRRGGPRPKAVVPVHLYGQPADMPALLAVARRRGLPVVEDCAQAHGAAIGARKAGTWGDAAAFSFYPTKNLAAFGDGGAVVTGDSALREKLAGLREYGWKDRRATALKGFNSRLDELQAALLRVQLPFLDEDNEERRELARLYSSALSGTDLVLPAERSGTTHVYHQYAVRSPRRDRLRAALLRGGVLTAVHYSEPVHRQPAYRDRRLAPVSLAHTERAAREVLSLPMFPSLGERRARAAAAAVASLGA